MTVSQDYFIDITKELCPLTFVRTKLLLERLRSGETLEVRLTGNEPLRNVPRSLREHGHEILSLEAEAGNPQMYRLRVRKA